MIYTVVCTDINDYIDWQFELLEYSWSRIHQPGKLVRLVACEDDVDLPVHKHADVFRTRPTNVHPESGDVYVCYNRLYSLKQWLEQEDVQGTILIVDADVIFRSPVKTTVPKGQPLGQHWLDYGLGGDFRTALEHSTEVDLDTLQHVTWPALIDADDLRELLPRWIELTVLVREQLKGQESDMFAFLAAAKEQGLTFELGTTTAFMPWPDEQVAGAPIIHYCQVVEKEDGSHLWSKQNYDPWERVPYAESAKLPYCRDLVALVDEFARLKFFEAEHNSDTIFIALASYCEPELIDTIQSCLQKARHPENLRFGICHQFDNTDELTSETCLDQFSQDTRFRYVVYDHKQSQGGCWARNIAQQLYDDETYTLQIDAHTQMIESWDSILIEMLQSLPSKKPLITQFPPLYSIEQGTKEFRHLDDLSQVNTAMAESWADEGWLNHPQKLISENNIFPRYTRVLSGAFVFTTGEWNEVVRQDPKHFYTGEEFALAIRSYTHGYDLFDPSQIVCWHRLHPSANRKYWDDNSDDKSKFRHKQAISRLGLLLNGDSDTELGRFGLGNERSLEDYKHFSGIDCINKSIAADAANGVPPIANIVEFTDSSFEQHLPLADADVMVDVTLHLAHKEPIMLSCAESTPVLLSLFQGLRNKLVTPDDVILLNLGEEGQESLLFKQSQLVAIETSPTLSGAFFSQLAILNDAANDINVASQAVESEQVTFSSNQTIQIPSAQTPIVGGEISDDWKIWIWHNVGRGCSKDDIFKQLIERGFAWNVVKVELNYEPSVPLDEIVVGETTNQNEFEYRANAVACRIKSEELEIYSVDKVLNQQECQQLSEMVFANLQPSTTVASDGLNGGRTSSTCFFDSNNSQHSLAVSISERVSRLIGINHSYAEAIQGHVYGPGEEYKAHQDWFEPGTPEFESQASAAMGGQRTWSVIIYLNKVEAGGDTVFERAGVTVHPEPGKMVFWNNLKDDGSVNHQALHQACPVEQGQKIALTLWYRTFGQGGMYTREPYELVPNFTESGIQSKTMSEPLFQALLEFYQKSSSNDLRDEFVDGGYLQNNAGINPSSLITLPDNLQQAVISELLPICEEWSQQELDFTSLYGVRVYHRGASLRMHTDTGRSHIISAILNIAQDVDQDWPLIIDDNMFRRHSVVLKPGEMVLYESSRLSHGRPDPLQGESFANLFVHFCPKNYCIPELVESMKEMENS
ncbi:MAG: 2OG-Fe(II) oxygenase [Arenicella sp.]|nr:2OG-Fe(II) oxygenase [Arenicella sp.]